ncbi:hypothetical protein VaNZ11_013422 [Volvox africanus]|uniref:FIST domain-containing protein n=1 Tax=Volvox africanus TaxID=51714 RepID=A0ABQ5SGY2_9CHLO|nr:hypothetical protein VaNZ11_013422 [Volvox africanus]
MRHHLARGAIRAVATACATSNGSKARGFYFVSASYQGRSLLSAATELALTVREAMGPARPPHLITLFTTPYSEWGAGLADTPQYVRELLTYEGEQPPVIVGGVLRSVGAGSSHTAKEGAPCVALLAAHLPGVKLMPFHTTKSSLPTLPSDGWVEVVRATRAAAIRGTLDPGVPAPTVDAASLRPVSTDTMGPHQDPQGAAGMSGKAGPSVQQTDAENFEAMGIRAGVGTADGLPYISPRRAENMAAPDVGLGAIASQEVPNGNRGREARHRQQQELYRMDCRPSQQQQQQQPKQADAISGVADSRSQPQLAGARRSEHLGGSACSATSATASSVAALLLSAPHFTEVEDLLKRLGQVAPGMQVIGGVTAPGAWGDSESNWGAVWLNDQTYAQGVVGCVLQGPFKLDTIVSPGFRGAGPVMRVTQAQGQYVLELDGEPVQRPLQRAIAEALNSGEFASSLKIGLGDAAATSTTGSSSNGGCSDPQHRTSAMAAQYPGQQRPQTVFSSQPALHYAAATVGGGSKPSAQPPMQQPNKSQAQRQLVTRNWFFQQGPPRPFMTVQSSAPIANGTPIQVHLQNYPAAHRHMRDRLREYAERLPSGLAVAEGAVGSLALSCSALPFFEGPDVASCLPGTAFTGCKLEGEFCSTVDGQPSRLHSFTSCLAFLRAATP